MKVQDFPGGWYADALPGGEFVVLITGSHLETHRGRVELYRGQNLLFPRCTTVGGWRFAGQMHVDGRNVEWRDGHWTVLGTSYGVSPVIYDRAGVLHQNVPANGSQGFRYVDDAGRIWTGDETYHRPDLQVHEYTVLSGGIVVGQDSRSERAIIVGPDGVRRVWTDGRPRFIRASRDGDRIALAAWREARRDAYILWLTVAEIATLPLADTHTPQPPPPPPPSVPEPTPEPAPMPVAVDEIDLSAVTFLHTDIREWPITSKLTDVELPERGKRGVRCKHTKAGQWPVSEGAEGVLWILAQVGGRWYAATCEWLRPGQTFKPTLDAENIGAHTKVEPLASWTPQPGEIVGLMVSTTGGRDKKRHTVAERSQVVRAIWPGAVQQPQPEPVPVPTPEPTPEPAPTPPPACDLSALSARLDLLREEYGLLSDAYMAVSQELSALRTVCEAERPIEINAGWLGTLRGMVGRPKA